MVHKLLKIEIDYKNNANSMFYVKSNKLLCYSHSEVIKIFYNRIYWQCWCQTKVMLASYCFNYISVIIIIDVDLIMEFFS